MAGLTIQIILGLMVAAVLCGILTFPGLGKPKIAKHWYFRPCVFVACFLLPFSVVAVAINVIVSYFGLQGSFLSLPFVIRLSAYVLPTVLLWLIFYRALMRSVLAQSTGGR
jgi:hypothetical protein